MPEENVRQLEELIEKYRDVFTERDKPLGQTDLVQHRIHTGDEIPIKQRPRREPIGMQGAVKEELDKTLKAGVIEPSNSA
jgi:hypothetical protein